MARCFACSSELKAAIDNPSDRSIISFDFQSLVLRNHECYNSGRHLFDEVSSKLQLCGFLPWLVQGLYEIDITIQATNWLADGRVPTIIRHALTALRSTPQHGLGLSEPVVYYGHQYMYRCAHYFCLMLIWVYTCIVTIQKCKSS